MTEKPAYEADSHHIDNETLLAEQQFEETEFGQRIHGGWAAWTTAAIAFLWSLFQLALPKLVLLSSDIVRATHLSFAMCLAFLSFPMLKKWRPKWLPSCLWATDRLPIIDILMAIAGTASTLYMVINYEAIAERMGNPSTLDLVMGGTLLILLLEAARRALGWPLPVLALLFMLYCRFAASMPDAFAFRSRSIPYIINKLAIGTEGVFGVPLDVSATTIFLFVLFGAMLEKSGGGEFFVNIAFSLLGRFRGGPAKAAVLASGLTGMVSGSSIANTVTTGTFTIPLMKKAGYPAEKAAAVEVAASTNGQLMPPIMGAAAFIIAEYCSLTYFEVLRAAFIPAIISYIALIYITHLEACKLNLKGVPKSQLPSFFPTLLSGLHFLIPIAYMLHELVIMRHSPQLSAFWAIIVLAGLIVIRNGLEAALQAKENILKAAFKSLNGSSKLIGASLVAGGRNMMGIGVAVAAAGIIVGSVTMGPGQLIVEAVDQLAGGSIILILLFAALASLVLGMGLPTTATYIVMASLTAGIIVQLADSAGLIMPLIAAHLFVFYFGILADDTPPVGLAAFAAAAIAKSRPIRTGVQGFLYDLRTAILPFMFVFNCELLLMQYVDGAFVPINSWWRILWVFCSSLAAMLLFCAVTQRYFLKTNRLSETLLLLIASIILINPALVQRLLPTLTQTHLFTTALLSVVIVLLKQYFRSPIAKT